MNQGAAVGVSPGEQCPQHQEAERERQAVGQGAYGGRRGRVRGLGLAATAWAQGGPLSPVGPRWSGRHSAGALSSLALTRCTDFFALGHGCREVGARCCWWHGGESWLGEGERASARAANLVFGECDMTNLSEIQTGESAFCRNIQAYPLPQVSNTSGLFHSPVRRPFYLTRGRVVACNSGI